MNDYSILKSGTDVRGRAIASEGKPAILTEQAVKDISSAFALWLIMRTKKSRCKIAVGRDSRLTGEQFQMAVISALRNCGLEIFDCGVFSTPAAFMTTKIPSMMADGAIMITASHHPSDINGLKFFTADGGVNSAELSVIIDLANEGRRITTSARSIVTARDYMRIYCDSLCETIRKGTGTFMPLKGMKIVVDAGHGAGGFFAGRVLAPLGADVSASQFLEPDGNFPAHAPNPENAEAMASLKARVTSSGADLGIIFDADVDRCAVVTRDGTEVNRCRLIALASAMVLENHPGATIVTDSVTTEGLKVFIESLGGVQKRFRRGYRNVIDEAKRLCDEGVDAPLAIESSGHVAFAEHYFLDDGAYFIAKILITFAKLFREGKDLVDLIADLEDPLEEADLRLSFVGEDWKQTAETVLSRLNGFAERLLTLSDDNYEGVRAYVKHADGYFIVRTSVHDPVLPIYIESNKKGGVVKIAGLLFSFLKGFAGVDCTPLERFIEERTNNAENAENVDEAESADDIADDDGDGDNIDAEDTEYSGDNSEDDVYDENIDDEVYPDDEGYDEGSDNVEYDESVDDTEYDESNNDNADYGGDDEF